VSVRRHESEGNNCGFCFVTFFRMESPGVFSEGPDLVCVVYPSIADEACGTCSSTTWSHLRPADVATARVPPQLDGHVPIDVWLRLLDDCYALVAFDIAYYRYGFVALLFAAVLSLLVLSPTLGVLVGGAATLMVIAAMAVVARLLQLRRIRRMRVLVLKHRPSFEQHGCAIDWKQAWVGGIEALSLYTWIEIKLDLEPSGASLLEQGQGGVAQESYSIAPNPRRSWWRGATVAPVPQVIMRTEQIGLDPADAVREIGPPANAGGGSPR
jgi:hypothetical protein